MENKNKSFKKRIKIIWEYASPQKWTFISAEICLLLSYSLQLVLPLILAVMIDEVLYYKNSDEFLKFLVLFLIIYIGWNLTWLIYAFTWQRLFSKFVVSIKLKLFSQIIHARAEYMSNAKTGDIIARIDGDADQFIHIIQRNLFHAVNSIASCIITLILVARISMTIASVMLVSVILPLIVSRFFGSKIEMLSKQYREKYSVYISRVYEILAGMREIRLFSAKPCAKRYFVKSQAEMIDLSIKNSKITFITGKINELVSLISMLWVYTVSALFVLKGELTVGFFVAIIEYIKSMQEMIGWTVSNYIEWQNRKINVDRVGEILDMDIEKDDAKKEILNITDGKIAFSNIAFMYNEGKMVLSDITFSVEAGEKVAVVGASGAGKTTLTGLMLGFFTPDAGKIEIDGQDISRCTYKSLRKNIGIVQQDILLFDGTIRTNLLLGKPIATDCELWDACKKAHIADYIDSLPDKLETKLARDGSGLSGGQKQRLMIARLFLRNPRILVFDEATSALDGEAEQVVSNSIAELGDNRTVITISHRLSTIIKMDRIVVIHDGRVVSSGTHGTLLEVCPYYRELFEGQLKKVGDSCA